MNLSDQLFSFFSLHRGLPFRTITVFNYLLEAALAGGIMILLMLCARQVLRRRVSNRIIYAAWLLVAIRLLIPLAIPNPLMNQFRPTYSTDAAARPVADQVRVRAIDTISDLGWQIRERAYSDATAAGESVDHLNASNNAVQEFAIVTSYGWTGKWVFLAYGTVAAGVAAWMVIANARFRRRLRKYRIASLSPEEQALYEELCKVRGIKRPLPVWRVDSLSGACLVGAFRPYIALPLSLTGNELRYALTHELCHYKARDPWWSLLRMACCVIQWFNPLVWIAARAVRTDCELACDDRVTAPMAEDDRRGYAVTLLATAAKRSSPGVSVLATGMTMNGKRLKKRLNAILHATAVRRGAVAIFCLFACMVTFLAFCTAETPHFLEAYDNDAPSSTYARWQSALFGIFTPVALNDADFVWSDVPQKFSNDSAALYDAMNHRRAIEDDFISYFDNDVSLRYLPDGSCSVAYSVWGLESMLTLQLDASGRLTRYAIPVITNSLETSRFAVAVGVDDQLRVNLRNFCRNVLGAKNIENIQLTAHQVNTRRRHYAAYQATVDGEVCSFTFDTTTGCLIDFRRGRIDEAVTQSGVMSALAQRLDTLLGCFSAPNASSYPAIFFTWDESSGCWNIRVEISRYNMEPSVQQLLDAAFGKHVHYTLTATADGKTGVLSALTRAEPAPLDALPADAPTGITAVYTEVYFHLTSTQLCREDTLPVGTAYTVVEHADSLPAAQDDRTWLLIRYQSAETGETVQGWIVDPSDTASAFGGATNEALQGKAVAAAYQAEDGASIPYTLIDHTDDIPEGTPIYAVPDSMPQLATRGDLEGINFLRAFQLAVDVAQAQYNVPARLLLSYKGTFRYVAEGDAAFPASYWEFNLYVNEYDRYTVLLDTAGTTLYVSAPSAGNG